MASKTALLDMRPPEAFRSQTFSNFNKSKVRQQLYTEMQKGHVEPATFWCAELVAAGHWTSLWELLMHFVAKDVNMGHPQMMVYLAMRYQWFLQRQETNETTQQHKQQTMNMLRNDVAVRELMAEVVANITLSPKKPGFEPWKLDERSEFELSTMTGRFHATGPGFGKNVLRPGDAPELAIAVNEMGYHLANGDAHQACYWVEWILSFDKLCAQRKRPLECAKRDELTTVDVKCRTDVVWIVWDLLDLYAQDKPWEERCVDAARQLFCSQYTKGACRRRKALLYYAVSVLTTVLTKEKTLSLWSDKDAVQRVVARIDLIYQELKKNEQGQSTDYLYMTLGDEASQVAQMAEMVSKLELMTSLDIAAAHGK